MAEPKVYWKALILLTRAVVNYIQRNRLKLQVNLSPTAFTCVIAFLNAGIECLENLPENTPVN